ncbi:MAG: hypothetical protein ABWZ85_09910, partial [Luteibacter sp.]
MKTLYVTPLLLALSIGQAFASTPINLSKDIRPNAKINIDNVKGEVTVTAWDKNQVQAYAAADNGNRGDRGGHQPGLGASVARRRRGSGGFIQPGFDARPKIA